MKNVAQRMVVCQVYAIPSFNPFDPFDKLRAGELRTRRSGQARRGKRAEGRRKLGTRDQSLESLRALDTNCVDSRPSG